ncbi:polyphosphate kinase 2 [Gordonia sp. Z-3]|jgi:polyphosphate kinase 2|uniref:ADP/GDP-polyphosphate phosphotransferase n=2 Tax=Gordonia TaxID=2053 RepID=A0A9X3I5J2_9ACTN|nr:MULTISPECIES: polyphosphate kinase 2 [Gordonia]MAU80283.1 polyphosphate kinase 2 [Gordonia sp. (in: high G+C Gram-positive bacteria)]MCF3937286.1 polyphosphate kinase 2 [Gordonia tangerina]MCX2965817.1 polyphosphate kinase 2 [Gordonia aquimaris]MED5803901.1 polyphosphate kinase 2 [Gordonia sp. Z-3]
MGKKSKKKRDGGRAGHDTSTGGSGQSAPIDNKPGETKPVEGKPMKNKEYREQLKQVHAELVAMQEWVRSTGAKICIVFEGRDTAGKGGVIKALTERVSPRIFRVVALPTPTEREKSQMFLQRYVPHLPAAGEVVIFDRSWYNRAGVERVMGFCTEEQSKQFLSDAPEFERAMVRSGILLIKYWLEVSDDQQTLRLQSRIDDPRKYWKLSPMDLKSYTRWDEYTRARDDMFRYTDTGWAPWYVANTDDKKRGRLNILTHLLGLVPYTPLEAPDVELPKRTVGAYEGPSLPVTRVPSAF